MNNELKTTIKNFLVDWDNTSMDEGFGLADYDLWMLLLIFWSRLSRRIINE